MLDAEQVREFGERGFVRLRGVFARADAEAMEARIWRWLESVHGMRREEPTSWRPGAVWGMQGVKRDPIFGAIGGPPLCSALDQLIGRGAWTVPRDWGQFLVTFPTAAPWTIPGHVWHTDFDFGGRFDPLKGALVLSYISDVPPRSGGTLAVAGSHRLVRDFVEVRPIAGREPMKQTRRALLESDPWLRALASADHAPGRAERFMHSTTSVRGSSLRVVELSGEAGDVVIGHPWLLHNGAPNSGSAPRLMRVQRISRSSLR